VGPRSHVLHGGPDPPRERAILRGKEQPIVKYREYHPCAAAMRPVVKLFFTTCYIIIRPHRSTTYIDAAYCYRRSSVVCLSVGLLRS